MKQLKIAVYSSLITALVLSLAFAYLYFSGNLNTVKSVTSLTTTGHIKPAAGIVEDADGPNTITREEAQQSITNIRHNIITKTVAETSPAVVGINVTEIRQYRQRAYDPFWFYSFRGRIIEREVESLGSGVIISEDGYIITNDHVAGNASKIIVTMTDGRQFDAKLVGTDQDSDICLLKIDADDLPFVPMGNSDDILTGEWVIALGNPFGLFAINDKPTVTVGVISATEMNLGQVNDRYYLKMLQTDAAINGGNSGGPLVNSIGELIGMNTLIYTADGSSGNVGVGFAIPINKVKRIISELKDNGEIDRNFWTGLSIQNIDEMTAKHFGLPNTKGVIITNLRRNSPGFNAGLEVYDIIVKVDDYTVHDRETLIGVLKEFRTGDEVEFTVLRNDKLITKNMKLERDND